MIKIRKSLERGQADHGWLKSFHTFSFADYFDPDFMGFGPLRVINEDFIAGHKGFGPHPHKNMEIVTYLIRGQLQHQDNMKNKKIISEREVQVMSAGSGIVHSEINPSSEKTHLLQIWIIPNQKDIPPRYEQKNFIQNHTLTLLLSPDGENDSFKIYQDVFIYRGILKEKEDFAFRINKERKYWIQMISGEMSVNDLVMEPGDGMSLEGEKTMEFYSLKGAEFILFDLIS